MNHTMGVLQFDDWVNENALNEASPEERERAKAWSSAMKEKVLAIFEDSDFKATPRQINNGTFEVRLKSISLQQELYENVIKPRLKKHFDLEMFLGRTSRAYMVYFSSQRIQSGQLTIPITTQEAAVQDLKRRFIESSLIWATPYCNPDSISVHKNLMKGYPLDSQAIDSISQVVPEIKALREIDSRVKNIASPFFVYRALLLIDKSIREQMTEKEIESLKHFYFSPTGGTFRGGENFRESFEVSFNSKWKLLKDSFGKLTEPPRLILYANVKFGDNGVHARRMNTPFATNCSAEKFAEKMREPFKSAFLLANDPSTVEVLMQKIHDSRGQLNAKKFGF